MQDTPRNFGNRLVAAGEDHGRLCVGIDPHEGLLNAWGLSQDVAGLREFSLRCVEAFAGHVALIKPQVAFYERFGSAGFAVLEETLEQLRGSGSLVVADAKRGDIGSTMEGYALAWLDANSPLYCDAVTLTPYLGVGSLTPAIELAGRENRGVFVMSANSNPEAEAFQGQTLSGSGVTVAQQMVDECAEFNVDKRASHSGDTPYVGHVGVVVGATVASPPRLEDLNAPVLMPGVGAQGATMEDVARIAGKQSHLVFPNVSRSVLSAGPDVADLRKAAKSLVVAG
ncbi:orotidine-5'-phosphate decarboxylase [Corynebacterium sp. p3-SID1145]|uniref:orotidine-5'-phosphate decarboxylase n=1 Tax=unclassified Corynebacterium TaxID=2624378 RepID=UPI0021A98234|nr:MULTISPECIES: orotidine-5'-phosphate decarboxylase [unclassified Corynebacterium]MCT1452365.1 orotidine-5'-phosphate decarboxylase [Corynebacterium sp. p3-SID1145]MCT1461239.1 orotidine-5'-phosphate decarboxylase [Corynebacterium sp. p3-SID1140]